MGGMAPAPEVGHVRGVKGERPALCARQASRCRPPSAGPGLFLGAGVPTDASASPGLSVVVAGECPAAGRAKYRPGAFEVSQRRDDVLGPDLEVRADLLLCRWARGLPQH